MARIVLNTFGSFGDLHPYLAIAVELSKRGHRAVIAASEIYRVKVQAEGVGFAPVRPDVGELLNQPEFIAKLWDPNRGTEYLIRDYLMPHVEESYEDLRAACEGADLLMTHFAAYAGATVGELLKIRWLSVALQPSIFLSVYDPPVLPPVWLRHVYRLGRPTVSLMFRLGRRRVRSWAKPLLTLRRKLGLSIEAHPAFEGQFSPFGTLGLFSPHFARPQPDWPQNITMCGFVFYDRRGEGFGGEQSRETELTRFLDSGDPPVVFTLGSSAVMQPGSFFRESLAAAQKLGMRAVLLVGTNEVKGLPPASRGSVFIAEYAPFSKLMPRAAINVHQGGIGTTAQALRAGKPMIVVPWSHDQPDNAERLRRLGVSRTILRRRYRAERVAREIEALLQSGSARERAAELGRVIAAEAGLMNACDAIERVLAGRGN